MSRPEPDARELLCNGQLFVIADHLAKPLPERRIEITDGRSQAVRDQVDKRGLDPGTFAQSTDEGFNFLKHRASLCSVRPRMHKPEIDDPLHRW